MLVCLAMAGFAWEATTASTTFAALDRASAPAPVTLVAGDQLAVKELPAQLCSVRRLGGRQSDHDHLR